jgi:hypothetical protein
MSDISNSNEQTTIEVNMQGNAAQGAAELSAQIVNLSQHLATLSQRAVQNASVTKAFNQSMGLSASGVSQYSREINQSLNPLSRMTKAVEVQKRILDQATKSAESFTAAQKMLNQGGLSPSTLSQSNAGMSQSVKHMNAMKISSNDLQKAMKQVALLDYSRRMGQNAMERQMVAYNFFRNFSLPLIAGLREAFFSYSKLATESNRTTKLILDNFNQIGAGGDFEGQVKAARTFTKELGKDLDKITRDWGTSRVLIQSLAGDFAELGISSRIVLGDLTRMTAETEKLGNLDISQSSEFIQTMYQTILRIRRETGKSVDINSDQVANEVISQLRGQLAVFNMIENKTVMSLRNISDAFPEVTAAATSFGLSMTEAMSLVIPMIGAGFQVGASANSVKVSLQRMVAMTKQNTQIINQLNSEMGTGFKYSAGVGMENIQMLTDAYRTLSKSVSEGGKGKQGALEFFSRLFGVRQGPRMETAFAQLAAFQTSLETYGSVERTTADILQNSINVELAAIGSKKIAINQFLDLSNIHRAAIEKDSGDVLTAQAQAIQRGQRTAQKLLESANSKNSDFISGMSTEVGKALMAQAFDVNSLAGKQFEAELKISQDTPEVRYRRAKESLMALGRAVVPVVDVFLKGLLPVLEKLATFLQNNPFVAKLASALLGIIALSGPIRLIFTTIQTAFGGAVGIFVKLSRLISGTTVQFASLQDLIMNPNLLRGQQRVVQYLDGFLIKSKRGARELREAYDFSGISLPAKEAIEAGGIYGSDKAVNMKRLQPYVPETDRLINDLKIVQAQSAAQMAAKVADASESGVTKGAANLSDELKTMFSTVMHRFQGPNLFAGPNYFEGNIPFGGTSGGPGSTRTPRAPRGSGGAIADDLTPEETVAAVAANEARKARLRPPTVTTYPKGTLFPASTAKSFNDLEKTLDRLKKTSGRILFSPANAAAGAVQAASSAMKSQQAFNPAQLLSNISQNRIALGKDPLGPVAVQRYLSRAADNVTLSFDQIRSWYVEAGKEITDELEYAFSRGGVFRVSQETLDQVKAQIFQKGSGSLFTLGGTDSRLKGGATITGLRKMSKKVRDELAPIIRAVSDDIVYQVDNAINQSTEALNKLQVSKLFQGEIGQTNLAVSRLMSGREVPIDDLARAREELFIAMERDGQIIDNEFGALNQYADDMAQMEANVRAKTHRFEVIQRGKKKYLKYIQNPVVESPDQIALREADELARKADVGAADAAAKKAAAEQAAKTRPDYVLNKRIEEARLKIQKLREAKISSLARVASTNPPLPVTKNELIGSVLGLDELIAEQKQEMLEAKKKLQTLLDEGNKLILEEMDLQSSPRGKARVQKAGAARLKEIQDDFDFEFDLMQKHEKRLIARRNLVLDASPAGIQTQIDDIMLSLPDDIKAGIQDIDKAVNDGVSDLARRSKRRAASMSAAVAGIGQELRAAVPMNPMWNAISAPLDSIRYSGSRFLNDPRFQQPNARMFDAQRGLKLPSSIKSFFGMDRVKGVFNAPRSLSAAAITQGEQIIFQFAEQLETQLGSVLANTAQADIKHITRVLQNLKPTSVSKDLAAFMTGIVNLPQDQIEMAMGNTLTEIKRAVTGQTGAGVGGKGMKSGSLQSWKAFLERMRRGSQGLDTDASGNPVVKGIREFFFSGKIKKGAINTTSAKGISAALESAFVASMKGGFLGLGGKDDAGVSEVGRRLTVESNRPGLGRQRAAKKALKDAGKKVTESVDNALEVVDEIQNEIQEQLVAPVQKAVENVKPKVNVYKPGELFPGRAPVAAQATAAAVAATAAPAPVNIRDLEKAGIIAPTTKKQAEKMIESAQKELARQLGIDAQASGASAKIKKLSAASFEKEIERIQAMIAGEEQALKTFTSPGMRKGPEKRLADLNKQMQKLTVTRDKYIVAEAKLAELASAAVPAAPSTIAPTGATGATAPTAPPPRVPTPTTPVIPTPVTPSATGGAGKVIDIKKIGHIFKGPNLFQGPNIFDSSLSDLIPNFDELMSPVGEAAETMADAGDEVATSLSRVLAASEAHKLTGNLVGPGEVGDASRLSRTKSRLFGVKGIGVPSVKAGLDAEQIAKTAGLVKALENKKLRLKFDDAGALIGMSRIKKLGGEMAISFDRANSILAGRLLPNFTRLKKLFSSSIVRGWAFALTGGLSSAVKPAQSLLKAITATGEASMRGKARAAIDTLVESRGDKKTGVVRKAMAGLSGATGGINSLAAIGSKAADVMFKIASAIAMIGTVAVIALPIIVVMFGIFQAWKSAQGRLTATTEALKQSLTNLKDAVVVLFAPLRDMVNGFLGASSIGSTFMTQGEKNAAMFYGIATAIKKATAFMKKWAETTGKAFMTNQVAPFLTRLINRFIILGSAIKSAFSGDKEAAGKKLKAFLYSLIYELLNFTKGITEIIGMVLKGLIPVLVYVAQAGIIVFREMFKEMIRMARNSAFDIGVSIAKIMPTVGTPIRIFEAVSGGKESGDQFSSDFSSSIAASLSGLVDPIKRGLNASLTVGMSEVAKKYAELMGQGINIPLAQRLKNPKAYQDALKYNAKQSADAATAAGESLGGNVNKGIKDKMKEIKDTIKGYFYSNVDAKFENIIQQYVDALTKQKDEQLKAYDDQIAGIDALAEAEERLTAKKEYETKRREMIDQRETDRANYLVERRLAVYEGRAFDVRKLDREEALAQRNSAQEIKELDSGRLSQLQSEQRDLAKQAIANQKDLAEKQFQEVLDTFDRFIEDVKNKSFATQEEFAAALAGVGERANLSSAELARVFAVNIGELPRIIAGVRDPSINMFNTNMDDLIREASKKFGLDANVANPATLLGAVRMMAIGSEEGFKAAFNPAFAAAYVQPAIDAIAKITSSLSEKGNKNNIAEIWQKAGNDAFEKLRGELNRDIAFPKILESFKKLFDDLKPLVAQIVSLAGEASGALGGIGDDIVAGASFTAEDRNNLSKFLLQFAPTDAGRRGGDLALNAPSLQRVVGIIMRDYDRGNQYMLSNIDNYGLTGLERVLLQGYLTNQQLGSGTPSLMRPLPGSVIRSYNGGHIRQFVRGGFLDAPSSQGIPALLHGGEYIINHKAVERFGKGNLEKINALRHGGDLKGFASGGYMTTPGFANGGYMTTPGFAKGGIVPDRFDAKQKLSSQIASQAERQKILAKNKLPTNFIGPVIKPKEKSFWEKAGGVAKEILRPRNSFAIAGGIIGGILGLPALGIGSVGGSAIGAGIGGAIGEFTEQIFDDVKGLQPFNIAKNALMQGTLDYAGGKIMTKVVAPIMKAKFPGVGTYLEGKIARPILDLFKKPGIKPFNPSILKPENVFDIQMQGPRPALPSAPVKNPAVSVEDVFKDGFAPRASAAFAGSDGAIDKQVLDLFDELDNIASGQTNKLTTQLQRDVLKARLQAQGLIPRSMESLDEVGYYNSIIDNLLGIRSNVAPTDEILTEWAENMGKIDPAQLANDIFQQTGDIPMPRSFDPRIIPASREVIDFNNLQKDIAWATGNLLKDSDGVLPPDVLGKIAKARNIKPGMEWWLQEQSDLLLPKANQPISFINRFGPGGKNIYTDPNGIFSSLREQMALAPRQLTAGTKGGALVRIKTPPKMRVPSMEELSGIKGGALAIPEVKYLPKPEIGMPKPIGSTFFSNTSFENSLNNPIKIVSEYIQGIVQGSKEFKWTGEYFAGFDNYGVNPLEAPFASGFNVQIPRKAFPTLPKNADLIHSTPYAIFDAAHGFGGLDRTFISEFTPTAESFEFVRKFALAQSAAAQALSEIERRSIQDAIKRGTESGSFDFMYGFMKERGIDIGNIDYSKFIADAYTPAQVDFISYNALKGQPAAVEIFERLVNNAQEQINTVRLLRAEKIAKLDVSPNLKSMKLEDITFVRELSNAYDSFLNPRTGAVELGTPGSLNDFFVGSGKNIARSEYDTVSGQLPIYRDTVHGSLQNIANDAGMMARSVEENAQYIVANLKQILDANPGALANLYNHDTQLVPLPFKKIIIPNVKNALEPGFDLPRYATEFLEFGPGRNTDYIAAARAKINEARIGDSGYGSGYDLFEDGLDRVYSAQMDQYIDSLLESLYQYQKFAKEEMFIDDIFKFKSDVLYPGGVPSLNYSMGSASLDGILGSMKYGNKFSAAYDSTAGMFPGLYGGMQYYPSKSAYTLEMAEHLRGQLQNQFGWLGSSTDEFLRSGAFGFGASPIKYAGAGYSETKNLVREFLSKQGKYGIAHMTEHNAIIGGEETSGRMAQLAFENNALSALHSATWYAPTATVGIEGAEQGIVQMLDLADVLKNNLLLRYYSTDNQFIQKYPGTFPGRFTRLNKIGERGYEPPPPPEPGSNQIDIKTGQPIGIGVKAPVSNKTMAAAAGFKYGGYMPKFKKGGYLKFKEGGEVPSILHGGEYVLNAAAVKKYGLAHLEAMNQMKFNVPSAGFSVPQAAYSGSAAGGVTTSTQNVNIYVDNFIGEPEWFNSMMKDYNTKILPKNQKAAGLENRVISTYNGLNRGQ